MAGTPTTIGSAPINGSTLAGDISSGALTLPSFQTPTDPALSQTSTAAKSENADIAQEHATNMQTAANANATLANQGIGTQPYGSGGAVNAAEQGLAALSNPNYQDGFTTQLNMLAARSDDASKALINSIQAQRQNAINLENTQATTYQAGIGAEAARTGSDITTPTLFQGQLAGAEAAQQAKIATINNEYDKALTTAQVAADNEDFKTVAEQNTYINQLKTQQLDVLKETSSMYQWANLSPYQQQSLSLQGSNLALNFQKFQLTQYLDANPPTSNVKGRAGLATFFAGQSNTTEKTQTPYTYVGSPGMGNYYTVGTTVYNNNGNAFTVNQGGDLTAQ